MFREMGERVLKGSERVSCAAVSGPDEEWAERLLPFLAHKGGIWVRQIERTLREDLSPLVSSYYLLYLPPAEPVANVSVFRTGRVGLLGHVFTHPAHRRKGAASVLVEAAVEDFRAAGGAALYLGTGYDSPPYHIYRRFGFAGVYEGSGFMEYYVADRGEFLVDYFRPAEAEVGPLRYADWPLLVALLGQERGGVLRLCTRGHNGRQNFEGRFLGLLEDVEAGRARCLVARSRETGAAVAVAVAEEDPRLPGVEALDAFSHPNFQGMLPGMVERLTEGTGKPVLARIDGTSAGRVEALRKVGFREVCRLEGLVEVPAGLAGSGQRSDLVLLLKEAS